MSLKDINLKPSLNNYPSVDLEGNQKQHPTTATSPTSSSALEPMSSDELRQIVESAPEGAEYWHPKNRNYIRNVDPENLLLARQQPKKGHLIGHETTDDEMQWQSDAAWIEYIDVLIKLSDIRAELERREIKVGSRVVCLEPNSNMETDPVNHPPHYTSDPSGIECIQITRHRNFNIGNAIKYLWRNGLRDTAPQVQDLKKAVWYIQDEIKRLEAEGATHG